jgi:hypothetical protein
LLIILPEVTPIGNLLVAVRPGVRRREETAGAVD